ncbi:Propeptide PepSY amd peptidase M4 [Methanolacinia petrolearia DSM 11571]|uniref:Propeptide PepSY amd peptidase M4 n=1 Tax=Methanolacinia petrolearia (strain DSM 11571 / OCM 486 / SEBR 4847) TaxID=679926 RepID=E1RI67_METP4|nr:PepSY domain-containing protein [Methanolacinia petrolearia]ADN36532.1 Propeptide PepSY amd peptidase M4 [Methanolacinia petrolearia DSM 11571]
MKKFDFSKTIGILLVLSLILVCSASALDNNQSTEVMLSPETIETGVVKENIIKFTGSSDENVNCREMIEFPSGKVYEVTTDTGRFYVNAKTGEIESAIVRNGLSVCSITAKDIAGMKDQAESFVQKNYRNFSEKDMVFESRIVDHGDAGREYLFTWKEMVGEAYTPSVVMISVFPDSDSIAYIGIDRPLLIETTPKVSQETAQKTALETFAMGSSAKVQSKLVVVPDGASQKLVWIVDTIESTKDDLGHGGTVIVDAVSGEVLSINPIV